MHKLAHLEIQEKVVDGVPLNQALSPEASDAVIYGDVLPDVSQPPACNS